MYAPYSQQSTAYLSVGTLKRSSGCHLHTAGDTVFYYYDYDSSGLSWEGSTGTGYHLQYREKPINVKFKVQAAQGGVALLVFFMLFSE